MYIYEIIYILITKNTTDNTKEINPNYFKNLLQNMQSDDDDNILQDEISDTEPGNVNFDALDNDDEFNSEGRLTQTETKGDINIRYYDAYGNPKYIQVFGENFLSISQSIEKILNDYEWANFAGHCSDDFKAWYVIIVNFLDNYFIYNKIIAIFFDYCI